MHLARYLARPFITPTTRQFTRTVMTVSTEAAVEVPPPAAAAAAQPMNGVIKTETDTTTTAPIKTEATPSGKLTGPELYQAMGRPKTIVAPMVDQSELAWRILSRRYGADLCYTPMINARLFSEDKKYRRDMWSELDGDPEVDRPLIVQFSARDPEHFLAAARLVVGRCDAVDLNIGCPMGIAKRAGIGAYLMEDWDLIWKLINKLHVELEIPVTAKIRIYDDREKSLAYAKHVLSAGAQFLTVHGRTREMKGVNTGIADWETIKYIHDNLPEGTIMFSNGNVLYPEDIERCIEETGTSAVMSAEGNLYNPAIFNYKKQEVDDKYPRVDKMAREYLELTKTVPGNSTLSAMKSHLFKILRPFLPLHIDVRNELGKCRKGEFEKYEWVVQQVEERVAQIYEKGEEADVVVENGPYKEIPYWRCQPYIREYLQDVNGSKRKQEEEQEDVLQTAKKQATDEK